jgi:hypothetical protein
LGDVTSLEKVVDAVQPNRFPLQGNEWLLEIRVAKPTAPPGRGDDHGEFCSARARHRSLFIQF